VNKINKYFLITNLYYLIKLLSLCYKLRCQVCQDLNSAATFTQLAVLIPGVISHHLLIITSKSLDSGKTLVAIAKLQCVTPAQKFRSPGLNRGPMGCIEETTCVRCGTEFDIRRSQRRVPTEKFLSTPPRSKKNWTPRTERISRKRTGSRGTSRMYKDTGIS
jgi:hypothetical protein